MTAQANATAHGEATTDIAARVTELNKQADEQGSKARQFDRYAASSRDTEARLRALAGSYLAVLDRITEAFEKTG